MDEERTRQIASFIEQFCSTRQIADGSSIGLSLRQHFPDLDLKTEYGGLRRFIEQNLRDSVKFVEKKGGDNLFAHVSKSIGAVPSVPSLSGRLDRDLPWKALVDPHVTRQLAVDTATGELSVCAAEDQPAQGAIAVSKLSDDEHRVIAKDFIPQLPPDSRARFDSALRETNYWPRWTAALNVDRDVFRKWLRWRRDRILKLFADRLQPLGLSEEVARRATDAMARLKPAASDTTGDSRGRFEPTPRQHDRSLHDLAHAALNGMQEEELRRVWLPFGAVVDALRRGSA